MTATPRAPAIDFVSHALGAERSYYSVSEVAALLGVSRVSIWRWISSGRLPVSRLGHRTVRIKREDLQQLVRPARPDRHLDPPPAGKWLAADSPEHFVLFYDADRFLVDEVVDFMEPELRAGGRAIVVATPAHREAIEVGLAASGVDVVRATAEQRLMAVDAAETLARFMVGDTPDPDRFMVVVRGLVGDARNTRASTRIFGEMVALLVADGQPDAALELEVLWNAAQQEYAFSLLCGYPMQGMGGQAMASVLLGACVEHSAVMPAESYSQLPSPDARLRAVVALQQKAASLEQEVTERRRAQDELQRALSAERVARDEAEAALRMRDEFLSVASHELRTPITVLGAQAQLSLRRLERHGQLEPDRVAAALRTMGSQADKLSRLVSQLLDISRLDGGKLQLEPKPTDLVKIVDQVVAGTMPLTERHTISLTAPVALECVVDALRLEQVLSNLLDNAIKYSPQGGPVEVVLAAHESGLVELSVRDYGLGIPEAERANIFERFYQAHDHAYRTGMGLGLYVSRHIVELHGGEIRVECPSDGGTRVVVSLPRVCAPVDDERDERADHILQLASD